MLECGCGVLYYLRIRVAVELVIFNKIYLFSLNFNENNIVLNYYSIPTSK